MDASSKKSVKSRRRSLRCLQPADVESSTADLVECHNDLNAIMMYGSIWVDQEETLPISVRKPRRSSVSNAKISHHMNKENVYKHLEKGTFIPKSTPPKMVEDALKRSPVLCSTKGSDYFIKNAWNNENYPEEIGVARFWQRGQDASMSDESFTKTIALEGNSRNAIKVEESKSKFQPRAVSPDILIFDSLETPPQINIAQTMKSKTKTFNSVNQLIKSPSAEKQHTSQKTSKLLPTVEMPCEDRNLNQSLLHTSCQQEDSKTVTVSTDEVETKTYSVETLSKQKWLKGSNASAFNQISSVTTSASTTKRRSLDSYSTSNVSIRRPKTKIKIKSINTTCDAEAQPDFVSEKNITKRSTSSQWKKLKPMTLLVPVLETADVAVVDLQSSALTSSDNDSTISDDNFNKQVTTTTKRRCQSIGSAYFSIEKSLFNDDEAVLPSTYLAISHGASDGDNKKSSKTKKEESESVGLTEEPLEMLIDNIALEFQHLNFVNMTSMKPTRGKRKSMGSFPAKESQKEAARKAQSDSPSLEPVKILDEGLLVTHSQNQIPLRRSTRRSSIECSLSSNAEHLSLVAIKGKNKTSTFAQSAEKKSDSHERKDDDDDNDERLREIYAKKPYVRFSPSRLETIYSPSKKRGGMFSKRKIRRTLTFKPSETQIKNRHKKAMRNMPFLFMVPDADEKLNKLLNIT